MKLSYIFPITKNINLEQFLTDFKNSGFFKANKDYEFIFTLKKDDDNITYLKTLINAENNVKAIVLDKEFTCGTGFRESLEYISGDAALLGDVNIDNNAQIFEQMLTEYNSGAGLVQVKKDSGPFADFFKRAGKACYNFFVKAYAGNTDYMGVPSLLLANRTVLEIFKALPEKANFLKNASYLEGIEIRTVFINQKTPVYKNNYKIKSGSLMIGLVSALVFVLALVALIVVNCFASGINYAVFNIVMAFVLLLSVVFVFIGLTKHILDVRMDRLNTGAAVLEVMQETNQKIKNKEKKHGKN